MVKRYINTTIRMALYLKKDLKFACALKNCSVGVVKKG